MLARAAALLAVFLAFVAGSLIVAGHYSAAQAPAAPASAPAEQPAASSAQPAAPSAPPAAAAPSTAAQPQPPPADARPAPQTPAPTVSAPTAPQTPSPVVSAPPQTPPEPPSAATPPAAAATSVVGVPALPPEKPAISQAEKEKGVAAKFLFASKKLPSIGKAVAIGYYPRGCLQGGVELPVNGPNWEVMRLSRNRNWGHPELIHFLKKFAPLAAKATGWHGVLIGDMAQPRGGPLPFGHLSHQIGLDVDIWFMPMPGRILSKEERENISATNLVAADGKHVNENWTPADAAFIRTAAEQPEVERVLVNAAIKKKLCEMEPKNRPAWMDKVRPWYGHNDHIHVRLKCPADSPNCRHQPPVPGTDGCGKELDYWFSAKVLHPQPSPKPEKPKKALTMADLPPACKSVLDAPDKTTNLSAAGR
ncbi:MAG TPA: penicillin-insensitive murein endopeptidase [Pseudolabrys sp.]|nr:penicillin-insensitive murein endopeptidase [Pseudolabrys sp.]